MVKSVNLIGSGRVASAFGIQLMEKCTIASIFSRNFSSAKVLAERLNTTAVQSIENLSKEAQLNIIAVPDDQIENIVGKLYYEIPTVHTSGSVDVSVVKNFVQYGVIYPIQTFSNNRHLDFSQIPFLIEGSDANFIKVLHGFIQGQFGSSADVVNSETRQKIHLSAVIANNFTNHLLSISENLLKNENKNLDLLKSLLNETISKALDQGTNASQTGPARRMDQQIIKQHLAKLKNKDKAIYKLLSDAILERFNP